MWRPLGSLAMLLLLAAVIPSSSVFPVSASEETSTSMNIIVDTDGGVDDVLALRYLLKQRHVRVLAIGAVAGNTTVEHAANNSVYLQDLIRTQVPVAVGAAHPLQQERSTTGKLIHGPDGLWGVGAAHPHDLALLRHDVPQFYAEVATAHPGATLVALGPLTNVAQAIQANPTAMKRLGRIVVLGGTKTAPGNFNAVAEFNIGLDPEAAAIVFGSGIPITLVTLDATNQVVFPAQDLARMTASPEMQALAPAVAAYGAVQTGLGGLPAVSLPDAIAAALAMNPRFGTTTPAFAKVELAGAATRGETIIATTFSQKLLAIASDVELSAIADQATADPAFNVTAELGAIAMREPDNVLYVTVTPDQAQILASSIVRGMQ